MCLICVCLTDMRHVQRWWSTKRNSCIAWAWRKSIAREYTRRLDPVQMLIYSSTTVKSSFPQARMFNIPP